MVPLVRDGSAKPGAAILVNSIKPLNAQEPWGVDGVAEQPQLGVCFIGAKIGEEEATLLVVEMVGSFD